MKTYKLKLKEWSWNPFKPKSDIPPPHIPEHELLQDAIKDNGINRLDPIKLRKSFLDVLFRSTGINITVSTLQDYYINRDMYDEPILHKDFKPRPDTVLMLNKSNLEFYEIVSYIIKWNVCDTADRPYDLLKWCPLIPKQFTPKLKRFIDIVFSKIDDDPTFNIDPRSELCLITLEYLDKLMPNYTVLIYPNAIEDVDTRFNIVKTNMLKPYISLITKCEKLVKRPVDDYNDITPEFIHNIKWYSHDLKYVLDRIRTEGSF